MPTFGAPTGVPTSATDQVSIQQVGGVLAQKSSALVGAVVTSDFTTTSASLVDVTGMTITLALTNNVATSLRAVISTNAAVQQSTFSLNSTATKEYVWHTDTVGASQQVRNVDFSVVTGATDARVLLDGFLTGTTSGVVTKIQAAVAGAATLTIRIGSVLYGVF